MIRLSAPSALNPLICFSNGKLLNVFPNKNGFLPSPWKEQDYALSLVN